MLVLFPLAGCDNQPSLVEDRAALLSAAQKQRLTEFKQLLLAEQDVEFMLVILDQAANDLDQQAVELFEKNRLGDRTAGARGLLLLVDPFSQQARIEVGYDLEGLFPDGFIAGLEYDQMLPFFQSDRVAEGVEALTELLVARLLRQETAEPANPRASGHLSGGAGARISTAGQLDQPASGSSGSYLPQATPLETLQVYRQVLRDRCKDPQLKIYTPETRQFFSSWLVTDGQQQNALRELERAWPTAKKFERGKLAVIRFPADNRQMAPFYLQLNSSGWQLDFATMSRTIGFNHRNQWHFRHRQHDYMFAFADWRFDQHGYPFAR